MPGNNSNSQTSNSADTNASGSATSNNSDNFSLQFLCSLIPKSFDGKRIEFNEFRTNCENAMLLANDNQKYPLLVFIVSKLTGNVRTQLQGKTYKVWDDLKALLDGLYQDQKHYIQLMEELNTLKQTLNESVSVFHDRLDRLVTRIINTLPYKTQDEQKIKIQTIKELALSRFIHHSVPDISRFLRSQNLDDISEAFSKAVAEERALKISNEEFRQKPKQNLHCTICKRNGHISKNCFRNRANVSNNVLFNHSAVLQSNQNQKHRDTGNSNNNYSQKFCRYCKKPGHLIQECRKRAYANNLRNNPESQNSNATSINLNSLAPRVDAIPVVANMQ